MTSTSAFVASALLTATLLGPLPAAAQENPLEWMVGCWESEDKTNRESWTAAPGNILFGHATTVRNGRLAFFEQSRIDLRTQPATYIVTPEGKRSATFVENPAATAPDAEKGRGVVFENPQNEFPQRLTYVSPRRNRLSATVSRMDGSGAVTYEWKRC